MSLSDLSLKSKMSDLGDDPDLQEAMKISMQSHNSSSPAKGNQKAKSKQADFVDLTADLEDEDEDMAQALALSKEEYARIGMESASGPASSCKADVVSTNTEPTPGFGIRGIDRKKMEQERLERRKRKATVSPPPISRPSKVPAISTSATQDLDSASKAIAQHLSDMENSSPVKHTNKKSAIDSPPLSNSAKAAAGVGTSTSDLQYPKGTVKKTWAFGHPRNGDDIKIEEVLQKAQLQLAVFSSFQWDMKWLLTKLDVEKTNKIFVFGVKESSTVGP